MNRFKITFLSVVTVVVSLQGVSGNGKHILISDGRKSIYSVLQRDCPSHGCRGNLTDLDKSKRRLIRSPQGDYGSHFSVDSYTPPPIPNSVRNPQSPFKHDLQFGQTGDNSNLQFQQAISSIVPTPISDWPPNTASNNNPPVVNTKTFHINLNSPIPRINIRPVSSNNENYYTSNNDQQQAPAPYQTPQENFQPNNNVDQNFSHLQDLFTPDPNQQQQNPEELPFLNDNFDANSQQQNQYYDNPQDGNQNVNQNFNEQSFPPPPFNIQRKSTGHRRRPPPKRRQRPRPRPRPKKKYKTNNNKNNNYNYDDEDVKNNYSYHVDEEWIPGKPAEDYELVAVNKNEELLASFVSEAVWTVITSYIFVFVANYIIAFIGKGLGLNNSYLETKIVVGKDGRHPFEHYATKSGGASIAKPSAHNNKGWGKGKDIWSLSNPLYHPSSALYHQPTYQYYPKGKEYTLHGYDQYHAAKYAYKYSKKYAKKSGKYGLKPKPILPYIPSYNYAHHSIPYGGRDDVDDQKKRKKSKGQNKGDTGDQVRITLNKQPLLLQPEIPDRATEADNVENWLLNGVNEASTGRSSTVLTSTKTLKPNSRSTINEEDKLYPTSSIATTQGTEATLAIAA